MLVELCLGHLAGLDGSLGQEYVYMSSLFWLTPIDFEFLHGIHIGLSLEPLILRGTPPDALPKSHLSSLLVPATHTETH